ncbi:hypothetical protein [Duganella violaceipulchra]|uniref:Apea-like HEPN domain-containing protein n=1 Tax=Duganella violaceipulchra TaxID=2849652 RepID=A0AA41HGH2_9BURK|nr:hypothetical protein [Duganella violaceicalia]MBV6323736.1 hypothetical protein [Duganella violaceicalia]MCP2007422.1 hypothetical protein [Duganella violaceicalia]
MAACHLKYPALSACASASVVIRVRAINDLTAFTEAMDSLSIYRGLWQLHIQKKIALFSMISDETHSSGAVVKVGNIHTVHLPDGSMTRSAHWHEDASNHEKPIEIKGFDVIEKKVGALIAKLNKATNQYHNFCGKALLSYVAAIDKVDQEARFVALWLCLELITGADDAKEIIRRTAFFFAEGDVAKAQLRSLRAARNSHVHAGVKPGGIDVKNFQMCVFVEALLGFIIINHFKFSKASEWRDFMSTATDLGTIDQQMARLRLVKRLVTLSATPA